jgi:hypothetical protein
VLYTKYIEKNSEPIAGDTISYCYTAVLPYAPEIKHMAMATATPINAATGAPKSALSSNQSIAYVNGFI